MRPRLITAENGAYQVARGGRSAASMRPRLITAENLEPQYPTEADRLGLQ